MLSPSMKSPEEGIKNPCILVQGYLTILVLHFLSLLRYSLLPSHQSMSGSKLYHALQASVT